MVQCAQTYFPLPKKIRLVHETRSGRYWSLTLALIESRRTTAEIGKSSTATPVNMFSRCCWNRYGCTFKTASQVRRSHACFPKTVCRSPSAFVIGRVKQRSEQGRTAAMQLAVHLSGADKALECTLAFLRR